MMNPIICVTDFDDLTVEAMRTATLFARRLGEKVLLVHSADEREQFPYAVRARLVQRDGERLANEARRLRALGFDFEELALRGMPEDGVAGCAWRRHSRLVVVGCTPTSGIEHWALGCLAEEISDTAQVPVLAVRSASAIQAWLERGQPLRILAGFDPAARPDALLNRLDEFRDMGPCTIQACLVPYPELSHDDPAPAGRATENARAHRWKHTEADSVRSELAARDITITTTVSAHDGVTALVGLADGTGADLLLIATHPYHDLSVLPHRALAHGVLRRAKMNVLCVPETDLEPPRHAVDSFRNPAEVGAMHAGEAWAKPDQPVP